MVWATFHPSTLECIFLYKCNMAISSDSGQKQNDMLAALKGVIFCVSI